jgi:hypothetical protein
MGLVSCHRYSNSSALGALKVPKEVFCGFKMFWPIVQHVFGKFVDSERDVGPHAVGEVHAFANDGTVRE